MGATNHSPGFTGTNLKRGSRELIREKQARAQRPVVGARPLPSVITREILVARPGIEGDDFANLLHHVGRRSILPAGAHQAGQPGELLPSRRKSGRWIDHLFRQLDTALGAGERNLLLAKSRRRQNHVRVLRRVGHEQVLHHDRGRVRGAHLQCQAEMRWSPGHSGRARALSLCPARDR